MTASQAVLASLAAYTCGSFPSAYLAGRAVLGVDLRTRGSGNLGATNVYREVGAVAAVVVLFLDGLKGWIAAALIPRWFGLLPSDWWPVLLGAAAVLGHSKPVFLLGKGGGKGVATSGGVFLAVSPLAVGITVALFALVVGVTRYVSAGSLAAAVVLPTAVGVLEGVRTPAFWVCASLGAFVIWAHRSNARKIMRGEERKIGRPGAAR